MERGPNTRVQSEQVDLIHPDFKMSVLRFHQNRAWDRTTMGRLEDSVKIGFSFDDPQLLNECPFVCKISVDTKGEYRYFGVAYGTLKEQEALKQWAAKFPQAKLFTYNGDFIENVSELH